MPALKFVRSVRLGIMVQVWRLDSYRHFRFGSRSGPIQAWSQGTHASGIVICIANMDVRLLDGVRELV
jgi:hypothetical protein